MDVSVVAVVLFVFVVTYILLRKKPNLPPGHNGLPLVGSVLFLKRLQKEKPHVVLHEESKRLGRIFRLYLGQRLAVVLSGYDIIHEALVKKKDVFSDRPVLRNLFFEHSLDEENQDGGIIIRKYGTPWRESRRFTLQALRDFGVGKSSLEEKIKAEIDAVTQIFVSSKGNPTSVNELMQKVVANVIFSIVFGKRFDYVDPEFDRLRGITNTIVSGSGFVNPNSFFPSFIVWFLKSKDTQVDVLRRNAFLDMQQYVKDQIEEHNSSFDESNIRDFIDIYIKTSRSDEQELKKHITKGNMFRIIMDLFLAGSETTSTALDWALLFMIEFPEVQKRCREEIAKVVGDKPIEYSDKNKMNYVNAVLMEIQRCANIVPLNVLHYTSDDTTLDGYDIPKDTVVFASLYSVSMDEKYFPEPEKFNPDRFIDSKGNLIKCDAVIPFSVGPRTCLGEPLARMEMFLILATLLQRFTFEREDPTKNHTLETRSDQITNSPLPYKLRALKIQ